jgi:hypothetical protein
MGLGVLPPDNATSTRSLAARAIWHKWSAQARDKVARSSDTRSVPIAGFMIAPPDQASMKGCVVALTTLNFDLFAYRRITNR